MFGKLRPVRWRRSAPAGRLTLAGVLVAAVAGVAFGTGYTTTKAVATDDSAWLQKGDTIVQVNGPAGRFDAVVADKPTALASSVRDRLEIVETPDGQVFAADPVTHKIYKVDLSTMAPQTVGAAGTNVLAAGSSHFVVNATNGTVTSFNPNTLALSQPITVPGGVASAAITPSGVAYIGSNDGSVTIIDHGTPHTIQVAPKRHPIDVSVVGDKPVAIDTITGQYLDLGSGGTPGQAIALPGPPGATVQVAPSLSGNTAWLIRGTRLVKVNPGGNTVQATLPSRDTFGAPLTNAGNGYVPDDSAGQVLVYDPSVGLAQHVSVPVGIPGDTDIQMVVKDGDVWADNPTSSEATVIHPNGTTQIVNKGTGNGVYVPGQGHKQAQPRSAPAAGLNPGSPLSATNRPAPAAGNPQSDPQTGVTQPPPTDSQGASPPASQAPTLNPTAPFVPPTQTPVAPVVPTPPVVTPGPPIAAPAPVNLPVAARAPITSPRTPSSHGTTTTTTAPPTGSSTTVANVVVPNGLVGKSVTVACQAILDAKLHCGQKDLGQAPAGQAPDVVTAVPKQGQTVPENTSVEVDYYSTGAPITIPAFTKGESPQTYCSKIPTGLTCSPNDMGPGNPKGQVFQTNPPVGSTVAYGHKVLADYYSSSKPIFVPTPGQGGAPTDPQGYCNFADTLGFNCTATPTAVEQDTNKVPGLADPSQPLNTVDSSDVTPAPSTAGQPYGTSLTVVYFDKQGIAVPDETNTPIATACTNLNSAGLNCGSQNQESVNGQTPNTVIAGSEQAVIGGNTVPAANLVVASGTTVNFSYDPGQTVPPVVGDDQPTACAAIAAANLTCDPVPIAVPYGTAATVANESPGAGTTPVATGSTVTIGVNSPGPPVYVADCVGSAPGACSTAGITYQPVDDDAFTANCNVIYQQDTAAGTPVAPGTTVVTHYSHCPASVGISEWHLLNGRGQVHLLEAGTGTPTEPGNWAGGDIASASGYVYQGGCPTGTVPLNGNRLPFNDGSGLYHYAFTPGYTMGGNWQTFDIVGCVFPNNACPSGSVGVYSYNTGNPAGNVDWSWSLNPGGNGEQWCELPG